MRTTLVAVETVVTISGDESAPGDDGFFSSALAANEAANLADCEALISRGDARWVDEDECSLTGYTT